MDPSLRGSVCKDINTVVFCYDSEEIYIDDCSVKNMFCNPNTTICEKNNPCVKEPIEKDCLEQPNPCLGSDNEFKCKTKHQLMYCYEGKEYVSIDCRKFDTQFCDPKYLNCTNTDPCLPPPPNTADLVQLDCNFRGFFPNPLDCKKFLYCDGKSEQASHFQCPNNTKYDYLTSTCRESTLCISYSSKDGACRGRPYDVIPHANSNIYLNCSVKDTQPPLMYTCPTPYMKYVASKNICLFSCPSVGFFQHLNKEKYYTCVEENGVLKAYEQTCSKGMEFSTEDKFCKSQPE